MTDTLRVGEDTTNLGFGSMGKAFDFVRIALFSDRGSPDWNPGPTESTLTPLQCAANGVSPVSGMLLIMKGFVRGNPDKRAPCNAYRGKKAG